MASQPEFTKNDSDYAKERGLFEEHCLPLAERAYNNGLGGSVLIRWQDGGYARAGVELAWRMWLLARGYDLTRAKEG